MKFKISHTTEYSYSDKVFFEPHYFRFKPKISTYCSIEEYRLETYPKPAGFSEQIDTENNHISLYWFEDTHEKLKIEVTSLIRVINFNPFDFLIHPEEYLTLPFKYQKENKQLLKPSLKKSALSEPMKKFLNDLLRRTQFQSIPFLIELTKQIHKNFTLETRETGAPFKVKYTFEREKGSCRDLAWMQIQLLRYLGIAARFVSGYFYVHSDNPTFELHAWVEVYLPGAGWIGFDPSHGMITGCYHIALASSSFYENTMPVSGTVRGEAKPYLKNELEIKLITE